ncbi:MAG TPA: PEP-CTERM sorting domain-containing protein [Roseiarcus sp.]|jgi:hypothetical protein
MSIVSKLSLAAAFAVALAAPSGAQAAVQNFSISLTDMTFERGADLSAEAAPLGGQPAIALKNNGSYTETLTGDYAVSDTLPPSDKAEFWQTFTQISLNGNPFFTENAIVGPESQDDIWSAVLKITGLNKAQLAVLKAILVNHNVLNSGGEFDYAYNPAPSADDRTHGTFAVGSDKSVTSTEDFGAYVDPFAAFDSSSVPDGPNVWSLSFSAAVATVPEPPTWLMLMAGGAGLLVIRGLARRPRIAGRVSA